jgi:hypothetical protein
LDFFYQPELTQEEKDNGNFRPDNVIGSYAVYASEQKINYGGGKEYKCGKIGHIYRPKIIDSAGTEVWGELHIEGGILSVAIPQEFLDKAVYPIRHSAGLTFGYKTAGTSLSSVGTYGPYRGLFTSREIDETGYSISAYLGNQAVTESLAKYAIYSGNNTIVNGLTTTVSLPAGGNYNLNLDKRAWRTANFTTAPTITANTSYYLAMAVNAEVFGHYDNLGTGTHAYDTTAWASLWPVWSDDVSGTRTYSIYVTHVSELGNKILPPNHLRPAIFSPGNAR